MQQPSAMRVVVGVIVGVVSIQAFMLFMFAWPTSNAGPRDVSIAVAGPPQAIGQIEKTLAAAPGADQGTPAFDVHPVGTRAAAAQAISDRDVYGAVIMTEQGRDFWSHREPAPRSHEFWRMRRASSPVTQPR